MFLKAGTSRILVRPQPWRQAQKGKRWACIGCGEKKSKSPHTHCRRCRRRIDVGLPVDLDAFVTRREARERGYLQHGAWDQELRDSPLVAPVGPYPPMLRRMRKARGG